MPTKWSEEDLKPFIVAVGGVIVRGDKVLLMAHNKHQFVTVPVGKAGSWQTPYQALCQEMEEEIGIEVISASLIGIGDFFYHRVGKVILSRTYVYRIDEYVGEPYNRESHKHSRLWWESVTSVLTEKVKLSDVTKFWLNSTQRCCL